MIVEEAIHLADITTFKIGGPVLARLVAESESEVREAITMARDKGLPWYVLGGGSNVLASDAGYQGIIIEPRLTRLSFDGSKEEALVIVEAGVGWDALVERTVTEGLWGIENLAGIPGSVGAAPVQNIGAYGSELSHALVWVEALDAHTGDVRRFVPSELSLGYRDSRFKREPHLCIVRIALSLSATGFAQTSYRDIADVVRGGALLSTPKEVADIVRVIRSKKFPDLRVTGTAGSFFKNPTVSSEVYAGMKEHFPELPGYTSLTGIKISLAFILDRVLGLKGLSVGRARLFEFQPLVIVAEEGATALDVDTLATNVVAKVYEATGISIEREVRMLD